MRLFCLLVVLSTISYLKMEAQTTITIAEVINLALKNNVELKRYEAKIMIAESAINASSRIPNPSFSYSHEDLSFNQEKFNEWSIIGSMPINFLWERWDDLDSREDFMRAQKLVLGHYKKELINKLHNNYIELYYQTKVYNSVKKVQKQLNSLIESANQRFIRGDISQYELQRLLIEMNRINVLLTDLKITTVKLSDQLKLLTGIKSENNLNFTAPIFIEEMETSETYLIKKALENRQDLKAKKLLLESEKNNYSLNKTKVIPEINVAGGYKKQSDNFKGSVFEISFSLPIFDRNQTQIDKSEIESSILRKELLLLKEKISIEVKTTLTKYNLHKKLFNKISNLDFGNLFTSASLSYKYGEISLVEFLDGINAYIDGISTVNQIKTKYLTSYFDLQKVIGKNYSNTEEN